MDKAWTRWWEIFATAMTISAVLAGVLVALFRKSPNKED